jgi:hypothetical protein
MNNDILSTGKIPPEFKKAKVIAILKRVSYIFGKSYLQ